MYCILVPGELGTKRIGSHTNWVPDELGPKHLGELGPTISDAGIATGIQQQVTQRIAAWAPNRNLNQLIRVTKPISAVNYI